MYLIHSFIWYDSYFMNQFQTPVIFFGYLLVFRLNSGNFGIFYSSESIFFLISSACSPFEIIDIKIDTIPWDFKVEIPCFNFCVGENVGETAAFVTLQR